MSLQTEMLEMGKTKLAQMKMFLDDLEVQMSLGKAEAKDALEKERKNVSRYVNEQKAQFRQVNEASQSHRTILKEKLMNLEARLSKDASGKKQFDALKSDTLHAIYELEFAMKEAWGDVGLTFQNRLDGVRIKLDDYRIHLALSEFEKAAALEPYCQALKESVSNVLEKMEKESKTGEKIDQFAEEMSASLTT